MRRRLRAAALTFIAAAGLSFAQAADVPWPTPQQSHQLATQPTATAAATPLSVAEFSAPVGSAPLTDAPLGDESTPAGPPVATNVAGGIVLDDALLQASNYFQAAGPANGGPKAKNPFIVLSGAAQIDGIWFAQDDANEAVVGDAQDVAEFRRSRLGANGYLADNVRYRMEYDFAFPGRPNFTDVWVSTSDIPVLGNVKVGQWKQPFSMEPATSFREIMFMERSLAFALVPFRQIGIGAFNAVMDDSATWAVSGYRFPTDVFGNHAGDSGYGMSTRETMVLWSDDADNIVHLGGNYTYNNPSPQGIRIRSTPEVGFTQLDFNNTANFPIPFFVDTNVLQMANYQVIGGEFAMGLGSLVFQSEAMVAMVNQANGGFLTLPAGYAQLGYVLTGERRTYDRKTAAFTRVVPDCNFGKGHWGAWEVAGRYSMLDLNDANVQGGRLQDLTAGINWYLNKYTRVEFNYIHAFLDRPVGNDTDADIFGTRAQFDF
jgi:phosphate-selective porin OprO/OprP